MADLLSLIKIREHVAITATARYTSDLTIEPLLRFSVMLRPSRRFSGILLFFILFSNGL